VRFTGQYRILLPFDAMAANGHDMGTSCGWDDRAREYPIIVGQRVGKMEALPLWRRLRPNHRLVYETDDDVWSIDPSNMGAYLAHTSVTLDATEQAIATAHMVTVSTEPLAAVLRKHHDNVHVLPNHIDGRLLDVQRPRRDKLTVGWAGGDSHLRDLAMVAPHLRRFLSRNPHAEFHNIGTDFTRVCAIPGRVTPWQASMWDYYRVIDFDVGLAPLVDTTFNASKSAIKALEYSALGIPVIASDVEPYRAFVLDGVTGFLVRHEHEWGARLYELTTDVALREQMGHNAKELAARHTIQTGWRLWRDAYQTLI
jgi:glycosyltransferase involved in cell wall biosynthesis